MYLHRSSNRYVSKFYEQSSEWAKLMIIYSTAQPIETHGKLGWGISVDGILHCRPSYEHAAQRGHFVSERSERKGLSLGCVFVLPQY